MTVLIRLHLVTGADPTPEFGLSLLVRIKITRTERLAHFFNMPRQAFDVRLHNAWDVFVPNDVRVVLDVRAEREHVFAEELP